MEREFLSERQLSELLGVTRFALIAWRAQGMPYLKGGRRTIRYNKRKVLAWLERNARRTTTAATR